MIYDEEVENLNEKNCKQKFSINKLYRASRDGWTAKDFHSKCDGKGPTLSLIWSQNLSSFDYG